MLGQKCKQVLNFCKHHKEDSEIVNDAKSFIRNIYLSGNKEFDNIPQLVTDFDKRNNVRKEFIFILIMESLFYIPFILSIGLVIYKLFYYIK